MQDPGLMILPTHRLIKHIPDFSADKLLADLTPYFDIEPAADSTSLLARMETASARHAFGLYTGGVYTLLTLKAGVSLAPFFPSTLSSDYTQLDVSILHAVVLEKTLGITVAQQAAQNHLVYVRKASSAIERVDSNECQAAFFLNATAVNALKALSVHGEKMPQKSTDFYPKLLSGFTIYKMTE